MKEYQHSTIPAICWLATSIDANRISQRNAVDSAVQKVGCDVDMLLTTHHCSNFACCTRQKLTLNSFGMKNAGFLTPQQIILHKKVYKGFRIVGFGTNQSQPTLTSLCKACM